MQPPGLPPGHSTIQPILVDTLPQLQRTQVCWLHFLNLKKKKSGTSLGVQLRIVLPISGTGFQSPVGELRSRMLDGLKKKKKERKEMVTGMSHVLMRMVCEPVDLKYLERIQAAESEISSSP